MWRVSYAEIAARVLLVVAICAMSWAFGGVQILAKLYLARLVGLAAVCMLFSKPSVTLDSRALPAVWLVLAGAAVLGFLQLAPVGSGAVARISPHALEVRSDLGLTPDARSELTIAGPETRRDLSLLLLGIAAFCIASQAFQTVSSQLFLCFAVAINGAAFSVWGLVQQLNHRNDLLPGVPCEVNSIIFSTYVNHSSAAGFLNMSLGATVGLLLWRYRFSPTNSAMVPRFSEAIRDVLRSLTPQSLLLFAMTTVIVAAMGASLSRGACLSAVLAFVAVWLLVVRRKSKSAGYSTTVICVAIAIAGIVWVGFAGPLANRYASLVTEEGRIHDSRLDHWSDGIRAAGNYLALGSGLGTYSSAYLTFERNNNPHWFRHAHNQYLEALVDGGIPGLMLMLAAVCLVALAAWHLATQRVVGVHSWFGVGVIFMLTSQVAHAVTDFGLYLPANMMLCAVLSGAAAGTAATTGRSRWLRMPPFISRPFVWNVLIVAGCVFAMNYLRGAEASDRALASTKLDVRSTKRATVEETSNAIDVLRRTAAQDPTNPAIHFRAARQLLLRYQARAFQVLRANDNLAKSDSELWSRASAEHLHAALVNMPESDRRRQAQSILAEPAVVENLVPAREHLLIARRCNPFRPRVHVYLAILAPLFGEADLRHLDRAELLSQTDAEANFDCGLLHLRANRRTRAIESWKRCLLFSREHVELVLSIGTSRLEDDTLVNEVMPEDPVLLVQIAERRQELAPGSRLSRLLAERVLTMKNKRTPQQTEYFRGRAATLLGDEELAVLHFGNAVRLQPNQLEWRYRYANALTNSGQLGKAKEQLQWCLGLYPRNVKYQRLMQQVTTRSEERDF